MTKRQGVILLTRKHERPARSLAYRKHRTEQDLAFVVLCTSRIHRTRGYRREQVGRGRGPSGSNALRPEPGQTSARFPCRKAESMFGG